MIKNYLKIAWRNLAKNKLYSLVNIGGLAAGICCCLLIALYMSNELSFDRFHKNADRLVRVTSEYTVNGAVSKGWATGSMAGPRLSAAFPDIESFVRILNFEPYSVRYQDRSFVEPRFCFADSSFFRMFSFPLIVGDPVTALDAPSKLVISESMAKKYFGNENPIGKQVIVGGTSNYEITAVARDAPANSQIQFDFIASFASLRNANTPNWWIEIYATYYLLQDRTNIPTLENKLNHYVDQQPDRRQAGNDYLHYHLEPITKVHLYSTLGGQEPNGNIKYLYILGAIAILILCIASVNYTNLATAQAARRIPEIAIRKVLGSAKKQLFWQFIGESMILNSFAFVLAIISCILLLPAFNGLVERTLDIKLLGTPVMMGLMVLLFLLLGFTSGAYPSFVLARLRLIKILKAGFSFSGRSGPARKSLIIFQFVVSVFLIISTVIIFQQLSYIQNKNLGYDKDHVLVLPVDALMRPNYKSIKDAIALVPNVSSVSCGAEETTNVHWDDELRTSADGSRPALFVSASPTDIDFVRTMGLKIRSGSDFTLSDWQQLELRGDEWHTTYMLNESAVRAMGWTPESAIGKTIYRSGQRGFVKAVVKDFNYAPLHEAIGPLVIFLDSNYYHIYQIFVKISGKEIPSTIQSIASVWKERVPHRPFQYHFLDENYNKIYHNERQTAKIFSSFSGLAILLACLGLFALAAYSTVQRAKEIGIRKVLGAGVPEIVKLVSFDFIKLVGLASLIAFPIAWISMNSWLRQFAYRIEISWWVFILAAISASLIALFTISFQAIRAALANPVDSLRSE